MLYILSSFLFFFFLRLSIGPHWSASHADILLGRVSATDPLASFSSRIDYSFGLSSLQQVVRDTVPVVARDQGSAVVVQWLWRVGGEEPFPFDCPYVCTSCTEAWPIPIYILWCSLSSNWCSFTRYILIWNLCRHQECPIYEIMYLGTAHYTDWDSSPFQSTYTWWIILNCATCNPLPLRNTLTDPRILDPWQWMLTMLWRLQLSRQDNSWSSWDAHCTAADAGEIFAKQMMAFYAVDHLGERSSFSIFWLLWWWRWW